MSDPFDASTPSPSEVEPDPRDPEDPAALQSAENLDEDELGADPLEEGVEPSEQWSEVTASRPTPREQREGESLDERLTEERPDTAPVEQPPLAETRMHELDETVDERAAAEVADDATDTEWVETEHGAVLEGEQVEPTGLPASTREGSDRGTSSGAPEEEAERVDDSAR